VYIVSGTSIIVNGLLHLIDSYLYQGTVYINGDVTVDGTWDGGSSVYNITGNGPQTITGTGTSFTSGQVTVNNTGIASLGSDTTITKLTIASGGTFNLDGHNFTVTNFINNGTLQLHGGETVIEPTHGAGSTIEYNDTGASHTIKDWTYKSLKVNATGQIYTMGVTETLTENLTVSAGTFDVNDQILTINGNSIINGGTMKTGIDVITFGNAGDDSVTISGGELQIESDNPTSDIVKNAGTWTNTTSTITYNAGSAITSPVLSTLAPYSNLKINSSGSTYSLNSTLTVGNNFTLANGTFDTTAVIVTRYQVGSSVYINGGTFQARGSTITVALTGIHQAAVCVCHFYVQLTGTGTVKTPGVWETVYFYNISCASETCTTTMLSHLSVANKLILGAGNLTDGARNIYYLLKGC